MNWNSFINVVFSNSCGPLFGDHVFGHIHRKDIQIEIIQIEIIYMYMHIYVCDIMWF